MMAITYLSDKLHWLDTPPVHSHTHYLTVTYSILDCNSFIHLV